MTNDKTVSITVTGLLPQNKYVYEFRGAGANWPTVLQNRSGIVNTNNSTGKVISTNLHFCLGTGICPSGGVGVLDYSVDTCKFDPDRLYSDLNFILKDQSTNEEVYNDIVKVTCSGCLPRTVVNFPTSASIANTNTYTMTAVVTTGLQPKQTYHYQFRGLNANWPTTLSNPTGTFVAKDGSETIACDITFCPVTGMCESGGKTVLSYNLDNNCIYGVTNPFSRLDFVLTPQTCDIGNVTTDAIIVTCANCLPRLTITTPTDVTLTTANRYRNAITHVVSGLRLNENYTYVYEGVESNWPTIITPTSGSFTATGSTKTLAADLMFCAPSSICPSGTEGLFSYTLDSYAEKVLKQNILATSLRLKVMPESCDIPDKVGETFTLKCSGCLPSFSYSTINFKNTPELVLDGACCTGLKAITVNVTGTVPGDEYKYQFSSASTDNVAFTPSSGSVYFGSTGAGFVNTVMSLQLVDSQQIVVKCDLTHVGTQIKTTDFLAIKCSGACSA